MSNNTLEYQIFFHLSIKDAEGRHRASAHSLQLAKRVGRQILQDAEHPYFVVTIRKENSLARDGYKDQHKALFLTGKFVPETGAVVWETTKTLDDRKFLRFQAQAMLPTINDPDTQMAIWIWDRRGRQHYLGIASPMDPVYYYVGTEKRHMPKMAQMRRDWENKNEFCLSCAAYDISHTENNPPNKDAFYLLHEQVPRMRAGNIDVFRSKKAPTSWPIPIWR